MKSGKNYGIAKGNVKEIKDIFKSFNIDSHVAHTPSPNNKAHTSITKVPNDNFELFQKLATESWCDLKL